MAPQYTRDYMGRNILLIREGHGAETDYMARAILPRGDERSVPTDYLGRLLIAGAPS